MANTRFKTENGLLVTGGNAQFDDIVRMNANLTVDGDLLLVTGDLQVQGAQVFTGGQLYTSDIVAEVDGLNIANTTNQFNAFLGTVRVFDGLFPQGNTLPLGNSTSRFVITANTLNLSGNAAITGNLTVSNTMSVTGAVTLGNTLSVTNTVTLSNTLSVTGAVTLSNTLAVTGAATLSNTIAVTGAGTLSNTLAVTGAVTLGNTLAVTNTVTLSNTLSVTGAATLSNTLAVTGSITGSANVNIDSGVLFVDATNNRVGINNTAPGVALRVTGAADFSSTANIQGNANVGGNLGVAAAATIDGNVIISGISHTVAGNTNFATSTLMVDSALTRVGIGTSTPDTKLQVVGNANVGGNIRISGSANVITNLGVTGALSVTGAANVVGNFGVGGSANALGNFGITGTANALSTLGVNGLLTAAAGLTVTGITNTSSAFNVGGGVATTNGASINNVSIAVGNTTAYTNIQPLRTTTFIPVAAPAALTAYANSTGSLWFYHAYDHQAADAWSLNRADGTTYLSTLLAAYRGNNSLLFNANAIAMVGNVNIHSGLNVGAYATGTSNGFNVTNNALLIGNTTANAILTGSSLSINATSATLNVGTSFTVNSSLVNAIALNVVNQTNTARLFVTTSANVGTAFVANTTELTHTGRITFSNTSPDAVVIGNPGSRTKDSTSSDSLVTIGRTYTGTETSLGIWLQNEIANSALTSSVYHIGTYIHSANKSQNKNSGGSPVDTTLTSLYATAQNAPGNSSVWGTLTSVRGRVEQSANGSAANSIYVAVGGHFDLEVQGNGVTTFGYGVLGQVLAGNNSVTGNIGTAAAFHSTILSNTAMTIGTGYLYYGIHYGNKTTNKYGLYLENEGNNYLSSNLSVLGGAITVGNSSITTVITGNTNARGARTIRAYTGSASGGSSGDIIYEY